MTYWQGVSRHYRGAALYSEGVADLWRNDATDQRRIRDFCAADARSIQAGSEAWLRAQASREGH